MLGGAAGYTIGAFGWETVQDIFYKYVPGFTEEKFTHLVAWYKEWGWPLVFLAGFSPIPYKVFTIAAGAAGLPLAIFIPASIIGRGARFMAEGVLVRWYGDPIREFIDRWFGLLTVAAVILGILGFIVLRQLGQ